MCFLFLMQKTFALGSCQFAISLLHVQSGFNAFSCFEHCVASVLWFQSVFGDKLVMSLLFESDFCEDPQLPSPCQLKHKILVKNKKIRDFDTYPLKKVKFKFKVFFIDLIIFFFFFWPIFILFFCVKVFLDFSKRFSLCNRCPLAQEQTVWLLRIPQCQSTILMMTTMKMMMTTI